MLTPAAALPLLLATALDASSPAPMRSRRDVSAPAPSGACRTGSAPSLESSPRAPGPGLRRIWSAVGCEVVQAGALAPLRDGMTRETAGTAGDGRVRRLRTRGPSLSCFLTAFRYSSRDGFAGTAGVDIGRHRPPIVPKSFETARRRPS